MLLSLDRSRLFYIAVFGLLLNDLDFFLAIPIHFGGTFLSYLIIISSFHSLFWVCVFVSLVYKFMFCGGRWGAVCIFFFNGDCEGAGNLVLTCCFWKMFSFILEIIDPLGTESFCDTLESQLRKWDIALNSEGILSCFFVKSPHPPSTFFFTF